MSTRQEDYLALEANKNSTKHGLGDVTPEDLKVVSGVQSAIIKDLLIPEIEREVNAGQTFANLRQIYNAVILASWYKQALKESLLGQVYVDQKKTKGVESDDQAINEKIYNQYVESFKKGVYNFIKEDYNPETQEVVNRKYFSGGATVKDTAMLVARDMITNPGDLVELGNQPTSMANVEVDLASLSSKDSALLVRVVNPDAAMLSFSLRIKAAILAVSLIGVPAGMLVHDAYHFGFERDQLNVISPIHELFTKYEVEKLGLSYEDTLALLKDFVEPINNYSARLKYDLVEVEPKIVALLGKDSPMLDVLRKSNRLDSNVFLHNMSLASVNYMNLLDYFFQAPDSDQQELILDQFIRKGETYVAQEAGLLIDKDKEILVSLMLKFVEDLGMFDNASPKLIKKIMYVKLALLNDLTYYKYDEPFLRSIYERNIQKIKELVGEFRPIQGRLFSGEVEVRALLDPEKSFPFKKDYYKRSEIYSWLTQGATPEEAVYSIFADLFGSEHDFWLKANALDEEREKSFHQITGAEIPFVQELRKLPSEYRQYVQESAVRHHIPSELLVHNLLNAAVWERHYPISKQISVALRRLGMLSEEEADDFSTKYDPKFGAEHFILSQEIFGPRMNALLGGLITGTSTIGPTKLRPGWVVRADGWKDVGKDAEDISLRRIAISLLDPKLSIEAAAAYWEFAIKSVEEARAKAFRGEKIDASDYEREADERISITEDIETARLIPDPKELGSYAWMIAAWHQNSEWFLGRNIVMNHMDPRSSLGSYYILDELNLILRSGVLDGKAIEIVGATKEQLEDSLKSDDPVISVAAQKALDKISAAEKKDYAILGDLVKLEIDTNKFSDAAMKGESSRREFLQRSIIVALGVGAGFIKPPFLNVQANEYVPSQESPLPLSRDHLENLSKSEALSYMKKLDGLLKEGQISRATAEKFLWEIHRKSLFIWMRAEAIKLLIRHKLFSLEQVSELLDRTPDVEVIKAIYEALAENPDEKIVRFLRERIQIESRHTGLQGDVRDIFEKALENLNEIPADISKEIMDASKKKGFFGYGQYHGTTGFTTKALADLARKNKNANELLISLSKSVKDEHDKYDIPYTLAEAATPGAGQRLIEWSLDKSEDENFRGSIARALGDLKTPAAEKRLLEWSKETMSPSLKKAITNSLIALGTKNAIDRIIEMSSSFNDEELANLGYFFGKLKDPRIETLIIKLSHHSNPDVRKIMAYALADLKTKPAIQRLLDWSKEVSEGENMLTFVVQGLLQSESDAADSRLREMYQEAREQGWIDLIRFYIIGESSDSGTRDDLQWLFSRLSTETIEGIRTAIVRKIFKMVGYKTFELFRKEIIEGRGSKWNEGIQQLVSGIDDYLRSLNLIITNEPQLGERLLTQLTQRLKNNPEVLYSLLALSQEVTSHSFPKFYGELMGYLKRTRINVDVFNYIQNEFGNYFMTEFLFTLTIFGELENVFSKTQYSPEALAGLIFSKDNMVNFIEKPALFTKIVVNVMEFKNTDLRTAFINQMIELSNSHKEFKLLLKLITEYGYLKTIDPRIAGLIAEVKLPTLNPVWKQPQQNWIDSSDGSLRVGLYWAADNPGEKAHYEQFAEIFKNGKKINNFYSAFEGYEDRSADAVYKVKMEKYGAKKILVKKFSDTGRTVEIYMYSDLEKIKESTHPILISRGHAGHVSPNYPGINGGMRLVSQCRSINNVDSLIKTNRENVPIAIDGTGQATETNPVVYYMLEYLGSQKNWESWKDVKDYIRPHIPQSVNKYNFPTDDVSLIFAAALQAIKEEAKGDNAMLNNPGGIDLNPTILSTEIKRNGRGVIIPTFKAIVPDLKGMEGFVPNIINVTPITSLQLLLGLDVKSNERPQPPENEKPVDVSFNLSALPVKEREDTHFELTQN